MGKVLYLHSWLAVILIMLLLSVFPISAKDYAIDVDPIKDSQNLFSNV